jgi:ADP-heptose:LPS heptosyltransferase
MQGNGLVSNGFTALLGARRTAGFTMPGVYTPDETMFMPYPADEPEPRRHLLLMEFLGIPAQGDDLEWPVSARDEADFAAVEDLAALPEGSFAVVHAGARDPLRRWPAERFAAATDWIAGRGLLPVLTGTEEERGLVSDVSGRMAAAHLDACGRLSLGGMGVLLSRARLVVSNDTGISHLAAAGRVPSVVIFSASDRGRWAPLDGELHHAVGSGVPDDVPCPHGVFEASTAVSEAVTSASIDEVIAAVEALLAR